MCADDGARSRKDSRRYLNVHRATSLCYGVLTLALQVYIVYDAVVIHVQYKENLADYSTEQQVDVTVDSSAALGFQTASIIVAVALVPLFVACVLLNVANLANDCEPIAVMRNGMTCYRCYGHFLPMSSFAHLCSVYLLLIATLALQGEAIFTGVAASSKYAVLKTTVRILL